MQVTNQQAPSPFIKWAGGKAQLLDQFQPLFPPQFRDYYEPFLGGGAVFFHIRHLYQDQADYYLSDINEELVLTYQVVRDEPDELLSHLKTHERRHKKKGKEHYYPVRAWDRSSGFRRRKKVKRAARLIYLNKTCFNGLWRVNNQGQFNVPIGSYKNPTIRDVERINLASQALQGVTISAQNFVEGAAGAGPDDFVYLDPPYVPLTATANFTGYGADGFGMEEQRRLAQLFAELHERGCQVMLSNSDTEIVHQLYQELGISSLQIHTVYAQRRINSDSGKRGEITEVVVTNY